ncbi:hypothetical protein OQA88_4800 [Cercophora sp. LCS_1]
MAALAALAKFASFTDVFLSGLVIPLVPSIIETRLHAPQEQVQILTSVLISSYGGALVAISPLIPLLTKAGTLRWVITLSGLASLTASFVILQFYSSSIPLLVLSRALHGLSAAATTGTSSGIVAAISSANPEATTLSWVTPPLIQSIAMSAAPAVSGYLYELAGGEGLVFYLAYAAIALSGLSSFLALALAPRATSEAAEQVEDAIDETPQGYGTVSLRGGELASGYSSIASSRSASTTHSTGRSRRSSASSVFTISELTTPVFGIRLFTALYGYLVVGLLTTALQSVVPLFVERHLMWSTSCAGFSFVPLSAPALFVGPLSRYLAARAPRSARFTVSLGFLVCAPAFLYLGWRGDLSGPATEKVFLLALVGLSVGIGFSADPLFKEITRLMTESDRFPTTADHLSATATLPAVAYAWGSLIGPLFAGSTHWISGWLYMAKSLFGLSAFTALFTFVFLQGWIGNPPPLPSSRTLGPGSDEESAPLLAPAQNGTTRATPIGTLKGTRGIQKGDYLERSTTFTATDGSDLGSSVDRERRGKHRRHFSIDNFSIATTAVAGAQGEGDGTQVRFQAALETPTTMGSSFQQQLGNPERKFVMREAPHAPAVDPLIASGNRYVIDETTTGGERVKRHVVVFEEGTAPAELLERRQHHVVAINSVDGSVKLASSAENHSVNVTEESEEFEVSETSRRYVVVCLEEGDIGKAGGDEST